MSIVSMNKRIRALQCFAVASLLGANSLFAADLNAQFRTGYGTSDNIARTSGGEIDEEMAIIGTTLSYNNQTARMNINIRANGGYVKYLSDTFKDQLIGGFVGRLNYTLVPERLTWLVSNSFGQRLLDPLARTSPGNRENVNSFVTGPSIRGSLGRRHFFRLVGQYRNIKLEESSVFDNERLNFQLQFARRIRPEATISLNVSKETTEFDNGGLSDDFDVASVFVRYGLLSTRNTITLDVGRSELETDTRAATGGYMLRMNWTRFISTNSQLVTGLGSRYTDESGLFSFIQDTSGDVGQTVDSDGGGSPFRNNYAFARYNINTDRTRLSLIARWLQDEYEFGDVRDRSVTAASIIVSRDLTSKLYLNFNARVLARKYKFLGQEDDQVDLTVTLGFRINHAFDVSLSYARSDRESNTPFQGFVENRGLILFNYTPSWGRGEVPLE